VHDTHSPAFCPGPASEEQAQHFQHDVLFEICILKVLRLGDELHLGSLACVANIR
jgi:hypothetical protein